MVITEKVMAKIENSKGRKEGSGYVRVFEGNNQLGHLMSRVHSTLISDERDLVRLIESQLKFIDNLDEFLNWDIHRESADDAEVQNARLRRIPFGFHHIQSERRKTGMPSCGNKRRRCL